MGYSYITNNLRQVQPDCMEDGYTDEELVALVQAGHASAKILLCQRYVPLITKYAHVSQLRSLQHDVESMLWEVFLTAIQTYDMASTIPFAGFVKSRIHFAEMNLFHRSVKQWNHETFWQSDGDDETDPMVMIPSADNTEEEALHQLQMAALEQALTRIDTPHAVLLQKVLYEGKSISTLAKEYGMSRQGLHKRYQQAIAILREELQ